MVLSGIVGRMFPVYVCVRGGRQLLVTGLSSCLNYHTACETPLSLCRYAKQQIFTCFRPVHKHTQTHTISATAKTFALLPQFPWQLSSLEWVAERSAGLFAGCDASSAIITCDLVMADGVHQLY